MTTVAPAAMQAWACAFCLSGSLSALLIEAVTPAFLKAAFIAGASNCTQRTDDFVSGSRTQTWTLAAFFAVCAEADVTTSVAIAMKPTTRSAVDQLKTFFTWTPFRCVSDRLICAQGGEAAPW